MIQHSKPCLGPDEIAAASRVLASGQLAEGRETAAFEEECAAAFGRRYAVAVSSGTAALHLALYAAGLTENDTVAIPSYACAALITAIQLHGARPILCDIGADYNLEAGTVPSDCRAAVIPHLFGARAALPKMPILIEDTAQSLGGPTGREGLATITSFYATKLMTTGEGGMALTDDEGFADEVRDLRSYDNRDSLRRRFAYKMTDLQAAIGRVQLKRLPEFVEKRRAIALAYQTGLRDLPLELPAMTDGHVFFRYVVATNRRDALEAFLLAHGVDAKRPVYCPGHHYLGGQFPRSEQAHREALSLPIYPSLLAEEAERVIQSIRCFWEKDN